VNGEQRSTCANERIVHGDMHHARVFYGTFFAFAFLIPLVAVSVLYGAMVRRLLTKTVAGGGGQRASKQTESMRAKRRVTRLVVIVVVIFAACWLPMQVLPFVCSSFSLLSARLDICTRVCVYAENLKKTANQKLMQIGTNMCYGEL